jgi:hypothetical protein
MDKKAIPMVDDSPANGLWPLVIVNAAIFAIFALSFTRVLATLGIRARDAYGDT